MMSCRPASRKAGGSANENYAAAMQRDGGISSGHDWGILGGRRGISKPCYRLLQLLLHVISIERFHSQSCSATSRGQGFE